MKDITSRLMNYDGFFEDSQFPRNPLTNNPLTQSQIISVWNQLKGEYPSSAFTTFRQSRWNINKFRAIYSIPLHLHAFRKIMRTPTHSDYKDRVMDFIQLAYEYKSKEMFETAFSHVLRKYPDNPILYEWATLCIQYYEAEIIYYRTPSIATSIQRSILIKSANLLNKQGELRNILLRDTKKLTDDILLLL